MVFEALKARHAAAAPESQPKLLQAMSRVAKRALFLRANEQIFLQVLVGLGTSVTTNFELRDTVAMMRDQAAPLLTNLYALIVVQQDARQIAEAYLRRFAGDHLRIESAGLEPAPRINPLVVEVMKEEGIDLSGKKPQSVFDLFKAGKIYSHVITVCHDTENQCPIFPGITQRWHWPFPDPAKVQGTEEEKLARVREIRDAIKKWLLEPGEGTFSFQALIQR